MSGRFPKCPNPECRRFVFKRLNKEYSCGGCKQTFQAEDLIKLEQKSNQEKTSSNEEFKDSFKGDEPQALTNSPSYSTCKKYPNILIERLNNTNPNNTRKGSNSKGSFSSASSVSSEETTIEREHTPNGRNIDESFRPFNKMLYGNYEGSVSSRSLSSDESGSMIHRNTRAVSRRTRTSEVSKGSNLRYEPNVEEDETKTFSYEIVYPGNESNIMKVHVNKLELRDNNGFDEETEEKRYERFGLYSTRRDDISIKPINSSINDEGYNYHSNIKEESESNYSLKLNESKNDHQSTESNFLENPSSVSGSVIYDEDFEESEYERNLKLAFERREREISRENLKNSRNEEKSHKYYSNDENQEENEPKPILNKSNYSLNRSKLDQKPTERNFLQNSRSVHSSIISEEEIEERETDPAFNRNFAYSRGRKNSNANSFDGSASSRSFSSEEGTGTGSRISTGDSRFKSKRTHRSNASMDERTPSSIEKQSFHNNIAYSNQQNELNNVVNELANFGITREKLIMLLLQQTDNTNSNNQSRNQRTLMRKLSFTPSIETTRSTESELTNRAKRNLLKHHCRPVFNGTPFVICQTCSILLHLPMGLDKKELIKIRCGDCSNTHVYRFPAKNGPYRPLHKEMGYESARFLMMPSRQFSVMNDDDNMSVIM